MVRDHRRLAAIVSADVAGYSRLMGRDDSDTLARLKAHRRELIDPKIAEYDGRIVKTTGDGLLLEFPSVVEAVRCAVDIQRGMAERNAGVPPEQRIDFRIGVNIGDIIIDGDDIYGDGVNVAARLQALAEPGGICVSRAVRDQVLDKLSFAFEDLGAQQVKNIARPVEVYRVDLGSEALQTPSGGRSRLQRLPRILGWRWLAAGVVAIGIAGIAVWTLPQLQKTAPSTSTAPAMSVAILPISATAGSPADEHFADALTEDLTATLGRNMPNARVASPTLAGTYKGKPIDTRAAGRELNVRYLARGELRHAGEQIVVNLQLLDAGNGIQVWSDQVTFDQPQKVSNQDGLVARLTYRLRDALQQAELRRVGTRPTPGADAMELSMRAWNVQATASDRLTGAVEADKLFDEALRLDPNLVNALIGRALILNTQLNVRHLSRADHDRLVEQLDEVTKRAVAINDRYPVAWLYRSLALAWQKRLDAALEANARDLKLDPIRATPVSTRAFLMLLTGHASEALELTNQALARDPQDAGELADVLSNRCNVALLLGRYAEAIDACEKSVAQDDWWSLHAWLLAAYTQQGDSGKAAAEKATLLKMRPWYSIAEDKELLQESNDPTYLQQIETHFYTGLRKAGIPEK